MTDRPIIFSGSMVRALLEGRKTQTRRLLKPQPGEGHSAYLYPTANVDWQVRNKMGVVLSSERLPFTLGDRLYVRENFCVLKSTNPNKPEIETVFQASDEDFPCKWKPSIHMPRAASRITLTVEAVKVERVQDVSEGDAKAEGVEMEGTGTGRIDVHGHEIEQESYKLGFSTIWERLNAKRAPWDSNPWVVAVSFSVVKANIDSLKSEAA